MLSFIWPLKRLFGRKDKFTYQSRLRERPTFGVTRLHLNGVPSHLWRDTIVSRCLFAVLNKGNHKPVLSVLPCFIPNNYLSHRDQTSKDNLSYCLQKFWIDLIIDFKDNSLQVWLCIVLQSLFIFVYKEFIKQKVLEKFIRMSRFRVISMNQFQ